MLHNPGRLVEKLNDICRASLEHAAELCIQRSHYEVDLEHWLLKLVENDSCDIPIIFRHYSIDRGRVTTELQRNLELTRGGNPRTPSLSLPVLDVIQDSWLSVSLEFSEIKVRSGLLLLTLLRAEGRYRNTLSRVPSIDEVSAEDLARNFKQIVSNSSENTFTSSVMSAGQTSSADAPSSGDSALAQFTVDLTARAKAGELDPVLGRDREIRQAVDILIRRRQNNPILTGEAGVGKTAVVEGLALKIASGDIPDLLKNVRILVLDLGMLQAGAGVKGEFEQRLKNVIAEVKASPQPIILFIDEAHQLIGAGGSAGQGDAANLLKPALARGELRTIAATTWAEFKKYFEKDAALARRFQVVKVDEPQEAVAINMMRGVAPMFEKHHKVRILDEAIEEAVKLSNRYITGRQLPDKCVSVLDTACSRVAMAQSALPGAIEDMRHSINAIDREVFILNREQATGASHQKKISELAARREDCARQVAQLETRWNSEKELVRRIVEIREKLVSTVAVGASTAESVGNAVSNEDRSKLAAELESGRSELARLQGESPLVPYCVDRQAVADVISAWTGVPVGRMLKDEITTVLSVREILEKRVVGQTHALGAIASRVQTSRARLDDPNRPIGVFLLVGPSGVGKTETALALADALYGGERNLITINMSEYQEAHTVSLLKGSPPGYVGYGEGGVLTEAVRRKPYSVVLLDEVEKAHADVHEIFFQVFDKGTMEDGEGRDINFKNTIILLTSNVGSSTITRACSDRTKAPSPEDLAGMLRPELLKAFPAAFIGRVIVVPYFPLYDDVMRTIIKLQLEKIRKRVKASYQIPFEYDDKIVDAVASRCLEVETGARNVDHILTHSLLPAMSREILGKLANGSTLKNIQISVNDDGAFKYQID